MLKSDINRMVRTISMPIKGSYKVISSNKSRTGSKSIIMTGISEKDIDKIEHSKSIILRRDNSEFNISPNDVICYGDIDFKEGSEDCETLDSFDWLDTLGVKGISIPARYNYDKHECTTDRNILLWTETFKISTLCRYLHGCLGKPKFVIIFTE